MTRKKGYKSRLPTVLSPPVPAPRLSPEESTATAGPPEVPAGPVVEPGPPPRSRRTLLGVVVVGPLVVGLLGLVLAVLGPWGTDAGDQPPAPEPDAPAAGALLAESFVEARVRPDGDIAVRHLITAEDPLTSIELALPDLPSSVDLASVTATGVRVTADDRIVTGAATITEGVSRYEFGATTDVQITYQLSGAVERSISVPGRALALVTSLDARWSPRPEREVRVVRAPQVLSLACAASPDAPLVPCGTPMGPGQWQVELSGTADRVTAQVSLTDPD